MSSSRVLEVQLTTVGSEGCLWAHSGRRHWWPLPSHLCRLTAASLSPGGLKTPSTLLPSSAPQSADTHTLWGYAALITTLQHARGPRKGGPQSACLNLRTSCALLGLAHHHPPPQRPSRSNIIHLQSGHNRNGSPHFLPHLSFPSHTLFTVTDAYIFFCFLR
jgi:hypothetical protein